MPVRAFSRFLHLGDRRLAGAADRAQLVELGVDAVANRAAVPRERRRLVDERRADRVAQVGQVVEFAEQALDERRLELVERAGARAECATHDWRSATRSRGPARCRARCARRGARDRGPPSASRAAGRVRRCGRRAPRRRRGDRWIRSSATSGRSSQPRSMRAPIEVCVRSSSLEQRALAAAFRAFDDFEVLAVWSGR